MQRANVCRGFLAAVMGATMITATPARGADTFDTSSSKKHNHEYWEKIVLWFGDEETGEWSLRMRDTDVHETASFEFLELWQFDRKEARWVQLKSERITKAIVLPKDKKSDEPEKEQTLYELKEIPPKTAGLWYAKWKIGDVECGTGPMRVGTWKTSNELPAMAPKGTFKFAVPIDLNKSEMMYIPDPRIYCVAGGPGKPDAGK